MNLKTIITAVTLFVSLFPTTAKSQDTTFVDRNCSDFDGKLEAQSFYLSEGGPERDPHRLDADGDGVACAGINVARKVNITEDGEYWFETKEVISRAKCTFTPEPFSIKDVILQSKEALTDSVDYQLFMSRRECLHTVGVIARELNIETFVDP